MTGRRVHCKREPFDAYIGRPSIWGNPFSHKSGTLARYRVKTRREAVQMFRIWVPLQEEIMDRLDELEDKVLGCWCGEDEECHGDVYLEMLKARKEENTMRPNNRIERTGYGWVFHTGDTSTMVPFGFNPQKDIDPIALHHLDELYGGENIDAEFTAFVQKGSVAFTPTHQIPITAAGIYLMRVRILGITEIPVAGEEPYTVNIVKNDMVQFVRIRWIDEIYKGTRLEPYVRVEHVIAVQSDREAALVTEAFCKAHEIDF